MRVAGKQVAEEGNLLAIGARYFVLSLTNQISIIIIAAIRDPQWQAALHHRMLHCAAGDLLQLNNSISVEAKFIQPPIHPKKRIKTYAKSSANTARVLKYMSL